MWEIFFTHLRAMSWYSRLAPWTTRWQAILWPLSFSRGVLQASCSGHEWSLSRYQTRAPRVTRYVTMSSLCSLSTNQKTVLVSDQSETVCINLKSTNQKIVVTIQVQVKSPSQKSKLKVQVQSLSTKSNSKVKFQNPFRSKVFVLS